MNTREREIIDRLIYACEALIRPLEQVFPKGPPITHPQYDAHRAAVAAIDDGKALLQRTKEITHEHTTTSK